MKSISVKLHERVVVFRDGLPLKALGPGQHTLWGFSLTEQRWSTETLLFQAPPEVRAVLPEDWYGAVTPAPNPRAGVHDGCRWRSPPRYPSILEGDPSVRVEVLSVTSRCPLTESSPRSCRGSSST